MESPPFIYSLTLLTSDESHVAALLKLLAVQNIVFEEIRRDMTTSFEMKFNTDKDKNRFKRLIAKNLPDLF